MTQTLLSDRDVQLMLRIARPQQPPDGVAVFAWEVLHGLRELVPCDDLSVNEHDASRQHSVAVQELPGFDEEVPEEVFWANYWSCLDCSYPDRTGDLLSVTMTSDFYSTRQFHNTGMYIDHDRLYGVEHEIRLCLPAGPGRSLRVLLSRRAGRGFTERDRAVLTLLRPHLDAAYLSEQRRPGGATTLTRRQREVLHYVAAGYSNRQIARRMDVFESTVRKHLENIFKRLDVTSRTAAVAYLDSQPLLPATG